jgi:hypothetical protein
MLAILSTFAVAQPPVANSVVGSWNVVFTNGIPAVGTFKTDGKFQFDADNPAAKTMKIKMFGKYHTAGNRLFLTFTGVDFVNTPKEAKAQEPAMKEGLKKQLAFGTEKSATITWTNANAFTTTNDSGQKTTFKRKR